MNSHLCDSAAAHVNHSGRALTRQHLVRNVCYSCFCIISLRFVRYKIAEGIKTQLRAAKRHFGKKSRPQVCFDKLFSVVAEIRSYYCEKVQ